MEPYQLTRTIRFKLNPINNAMQNEVNSLQNAQSREAIATELDGLLEQFTEELNNYLFIKPSSDKSQNKNSEVDRLINPNIEIKKYWLKQYTREYYYQQSTDFFKLSSHRVLQVPYLPKVIRKWDRDWNNVRNELRELLNRPLEKQAKRAEFGLIIAEYKKKQMFHFIRDFIDQSQDKNTDEQKYSLVLLVAQLGKLLNHCEQAYLPFQSGGIVIARASLNYYTINKKPKDYESEIKSLKDSLNTEIEKNHNKVISYLKCSGRKGRKGCEQYVNELREFVVNDIFKDTNSKITLDLLYTKMKEYKADKKQEFLEAVDAGLEYDNLEKKHPLFKCKQHDYQYYLDKTKEIKIKSEKLSKLDKKSADYFTKRNDLKKEISKLKTKRSEAFFFVGSGMKKGAMHYKKSGAVRYKKSGAVRYKKSGAVRYKKFCELYKYIAMLRGKKIAQIKGIQREQQDSQLLNYWAVMMEKDKQHYLVAIPREYASKAYKALNTKSETNNSKIKIHYFKSLTMRALQKLCFGTQGNTFAKEIKNELNASSDYKNKYNKIQGAFSFEKFNEKTREIEIVRFYQAVLATKYVEENLDIHDFIELKTLINDKTIQTINEFQKQLERICYVKRELYGENVESYLKNKCNAQIFEITSYDLRKHSSRKGKDKLHTQIWKAFWSDENKQRHYPTRLNPELKIIWRAAKESRIEKYGNNSGNFDPNKDNRYLHPQFTLATTITENALGERLDLSFVKQDKLASAIRKFNKQFYEEYVSNPQKTYYYGIDRGLEELASLAIVESFSETLNEFNQPIPKLAKFDVWRLKDEYLDYSEEYLSDGQPKIRRAINNLSYFIEKTDLFDKQFKSSIDLTTAKLIKGKIVENGDVLSYLKLKELSAKRRIYRYFSQAKIDRSKSPVIYFNNNKFCVHTYGKSEAIYYYRPDLEKVRTKESIETMLNKYLQGLETNNQERHILTIEKINHLRDALAANMVGIISHLYINKKMRGIIALENLIAAKLLRRDENISRQLEMRLYNKFQNQGLVPPKLKETILLRECKEINQFGLIHFMPKENTSKKCPYCGTKCSKPEDEWKNDKYKKRVFDCTNPDCNFNSKTNKRGLIDFDSPDIVASYNIAKLAYQYASSSPSFDDPIEQTEQKRNSRNNRKRKHKNKGKPNKQK